MNQKGKIFADWDLRKFFARPEVLSSENGVCECGLCEECTSALDPDMFLMDLPVEEEEDDSYYDSYIEQFWDYDIDIYGDIEYDIQYSDPEVIRALNDPVTRFNAHIYESDKRSVQLQQLLILKRLVDQVDEWQTQSPNAWI